MSIRWQIPFLTERAEYSVNVYDEDYTGAPIQLKGGTDPFVIQEEKDEDAFSPVRRSSGYINILVEDRDLIDQIKADSGFSHPVDLVENGVVVWRGFIQPAVYSVAWDCAPLPISIPVYSVLAALDDVTYTPANEYLQIGRIIQKALLGRADFTEYFTPDTWTGNDHPFRAAANDIVFSSQRKGVTKYPGTGWDIEMPESGFSCLDVIREVCKFCGWTAREKGTALYFISVNDTCNYLRGSVNSIANASPSVPAERETLSLPDVRGVSHTQTEVEGFRYIDIKEDLGTLTPVFNLDLTPYAPAGYAGRDSGGGFGPETGEEATTEAQVRENQYNLWVRYSDSEEFVQKQYNSTGQPLSVNTEIWQYSPRGAGNWGGQLMRFLYDDVSTDGFTHGNVDRGGLQSVIGIIHGKASLSPTTKIVAQIRAPFKICGHLYENIGFALSGDVSTLNSSFKRQDSTVKYLTVRLQWGPVAGNYYYWQETQASAGWSRTPSTFRVRVVDGKICGYWSPRPTLIQRDRDFRYFPTKGDINASMILSIYGLEESSNQYATVISNFSFTAASGNERLIRTDARLDLSENHFKADLGGVRKTAYEQTCILASRLQKYQISDAIVLDKTLQADYSVVPATNLLDRLKKWYSRAVPQLQITVLHAFGLSPFAVIEILGLPYEVVSVETNYWRDVDVLTLQLRQTDSQGEDETPEDESGGEDEEGWLYDIYGQPLADVNNELLKSAEQ